MYVGVIILKEKNLKISLIYYSTINFHANILSDVFLKLEHNVKVIFGGCKFFRIKDHEHFLVFLRRKLYFIFFLLQNFQGIIIKIQLQPCTLMVRALNVQSCYKHNFICQHVSYLMHPHICTVKSSSLNTQ